MAKLSKALRTDLNEMAALLRSKGRGRDTILAHITPQEAALLKRRGGRGSINPDTGLPEFEEDYSGYEPGSFAYGETLGVPGGYLGGGDAGATAPPAEVSAPQVTAPEPVTTAYWEKYLPGGFPSEQQTPEQQQANAAAWEAYFNQPQDATVATSGATGQLPFIPGVTQPTGVYPSTVPASLQESRAGAQVYGGDTKTETPPPDKGVLDKFEELAKKYPKSTSALESLLGAGAKVGLGYLGAKPMQRTQTKAAQEAQQMGEQFAAMGKPIQAMGYQQLAQAEAGQLTPAQQRQIDATRAQQRQALSRAGITSGTAALQTEANLQRMANEFTQNNINTALNMIQFGDKYVAQGIKAGYDANLAANQSANIFYQNLFGLLGGTGNVLRG